MRSGPLLIGMMSRFCFAGLGEGVGLSEHSDGQSRFLVQTLVPSTIERVQQVDEEALVDFQNPD